MEELTLNVAKDGVLRSVLVADRSTNTPLFHIPSMVGIDLDRVATMIATDSYTKRKSIHDYKIYVEASAIEVEPLIDRARSIGRTYMMSTSPEEQARLSIGRLSTRQKQVLSLIEDGFTNKAIGIQLSLSERTVKFHVTCLLDRFNVRSRYDLAKRLRFGYRTEDEAIKQGLRVAGETDATSNEDSSRLAG